METDLAGRLTYWVTCEIFGLDVMVAKTDGSNRGHYAIQAESHAQMLLLDASPSNMP